MKPLWQFQNEGARWLAGRRFALLADDMGLGKTAQIITAADLVFARTILIIPPAGVRFVWEDQIAEWSMFGHEVVVLTTSKDRPKAGCINIINYDLLARGFEKTSYKHNEFLKSILAIYWDLIVCDEAHYLKDRTSLRTRAVLENKALAGRTKRLWLATGTPMPNGPWELWVILTALAATTLDYDQFVKRYCIMGKGYHRFEPVAANPETADELKAILGRVMMRRIKEFVLPQLPALRIEDFPVPQVDIRIEDFFEDALVNKKQVMDKIKSEQEFVQEVIYRAQGEGTMDTYAVIRALEAVGSSVSFYRRWLGSVKAVSMLPIIRDELANNAVDKIFIFAWSRQVINYLNAQLEEFNPRVIAGGVSQIQRRNIINEFKEDKSDSRPRVGIGQIIACGTGLDGLQHSFCEGIILEPDWVPLNNAQPIGRLHRAGQLLPVRVRMARLKNTLDDYISLTELRKVKEICRIVGN